MLKKKTVNYNSYNIAHGNTFVAEDEISYSLICWAFARAFAWLIWSNFSLI
jgi:hypothetical protein